MVYVFMCVCMETFTSRRHSFDWSSEGVDHMELMKNSQQESNIVHPALSDPKTEIVIEVSPNTLLDTNRFVCHVCNKGFSREQNLALHRRVHNLPFHLKTRTTKGPTPRKVYICPEPTCIHHNRSRALGDFGGLKKHYLRKHGTVKKHKCNNCSRAYAVESDFIAHSKVCIIRKYNCECGIHFSSHSKFKNHLEYCGDAAKAPENSEIRNNSVRSTKNKNSSSFIGSTSSNLPLSDMGHNSVRSIINNNNDNHIRFTTSPFFHFTTHNESNSAIFSPLSTDQNQHEFQVTNGIYTNLMMNGGSREGSNLFSDRCMMSNNSLSLNVTSDFPNATFEQQLSASRNNITSNMVQGYGSSFSSEVGGFMMPQEHTALFGSENFNLADNSGFDGIQNPFLNHVSRSGVGSSIVNEGIGGNYHGYGEGGRELTTDAVAPSGEQYWNEHGFWF